MDVTWHRMASTQLRQPQICAASGAPATSLLPMVFRNRTSYYLPGMVQVAGRPTADQRLSW